VKHNIVRVEIETIKPETVVRGGMIDVFLKPPLRYCWFHHLPANILDISTPDRNLRFIEGGHFLRFDALGLETDGCNAGDVEFLINSLGADILFKNVLRMLVGRAEASTEIFKERPTWVGLAYYEVAYATVKFERWIDLEEFEAQYPAIFPASSEGLRTKNLEAALREIAKGAGPFSRDPLTHAFNCIESMKAIAVEALGNVSDSGNKETP